MWYQGIISFSGPREFVPIIHKMTNAIAHRGPDDVVWRKNKVGFVAPEREWLNQLKSDATTLLKKESEKLSTFINIPMVLDECARMSEPLLWRILNFAKWYNVFRPGVDV